MLKKIKKIISFVFGMVIIVSLNIVNVSAATETANVSISSTTAAQGQNVTVTVKITSSVEMAMLEFHLNYDKNILEYKSGDAGGGSGLLSVSDYDTTANSVTYTLNFTAIAAGTTNITYDETALSGISPSDPQYENDYDRLNISGGTGTVTVAAPSTASANADLSALKVSAQTDSGATKTLSLSPEFSANTTKYYLTLDEDISKLVVSATAKDAKAKTSISGTSIIPGNNVTTITVTAENGSTKKYYIYSSQGDAAIDVETEGLSVQIGDKLMQIVSSLEGITLPTGFEKTIIGYNSINIEAAASATKGLTLLYVNSEESGEGLFYIYNPEDGSFYKFQNIIVGSATYTIIKVDDTIVVPDSYTRTVLNINGQEIDGWINDSDQEFGLVYAVNDLGEKNLYMYDFKEGTIQRLNENLYMGMNGQGMEGLENSLAHANETKSRLLWIVIGLSVAIIAIFVLFMIMLVEKRKAKLPEEPETEKEEELIKEYARANVFAAPILPKELVDPEMPRELLMGKFFEDEIFEDNFEKDEIVEEDSLEENESEEYFEEETTSFEDMRSRIFEGFDDDDDDIEVVDLDDEE